MSGCGCDKNTSCDNVKRDEEKIHQELPLNETPKNKDISCSSSAKSCCEPPTTIETAHKSVSHSVFISDYIIPKMDCSAEEQMVRMSLSSMDNIHKLIFDLPNRNLKVVHDEDTNLITTKLEALGFGAKLNTTTPYIDKATGQTSTYIIPKMDCSAEEQMVRMTLASVSQVKGLAFDLPNRTLQVFHTDGITEITAKLVSLGFGARLEKTIQTVADIQQSPDTTEQSKVLKILLAINGVLFFIEFITGIIAASTGLIADSLDMFADAAVYGIALYAVGKGAKYQLKAAHFSGWIQLFLAIIVISDVIRRFIFGSEPESSLMMIIGFIALIANAFCLYLITGHKEGGAHMKASWVFTANDVIVNMGVILAGVLVAWTGSAYPDLIIGIIVSLFVLNGARRILALK